MLVTPSRTRTTKSKEGWKAIELVVDYAHAIGRVENRGSCILMSIPVPANSVHNGFISTQAVLLTTSFVLHNREEAMGKKATFLEHPVTGSGARGDIRPTEVDLRADSIFFCSAREPPKRHIDYVIDDRLRAEREAQGLTEEGEEYQIEELGYTICACDLTSRSDPRNDLLKITPLPLPLLLDTIPDVHVGDTHLLITHENSATRRYVVATVIDVEEHHCAYEFDDPTCQFASGGAIFTSTGEFVGLQHQCGANSYGIFIRDVVLHLFESGMLGLCRIPVLSADSEDARDEEGELNPNAAVSDLEFNQPFHATQRGRLMDVGAGDQIVSFEELEIVRQRQAKGTTKGKTLQARRHTEVWAYWTSVRGAPGSASYYQGLILLLSAFPFQSKLCTRILAELTCHENRHHIASVSSYGGVGMILEVIDSHPHDQVLVQTAVTSLARISLYDANKESLARSDGVPAILAVMREYLMVYDVQQWAFYLLLNLVLDGSEADTCASTIVKYAGLEVMLHGLERHPQGTHLQRWGWQCVGQIVRRCCSSDATALIVAGLGGPRLMVEQWERFWKNGFVCFGMAFALHCFLRVDDSHPQTSFANGMAFLDLLLGLQQPLHRHTVTNPDEDPEDVTPEILDRRQEEAHIQNDCCKATGILKFIFTLMEYHSKHVTSDSASLMEYLLISYLDVLTLRRDVVKPEERDQQEELVARVTKVFMTEARMHMIADRILRILGVLDPFVKYSHLMRDRNPNVHKDL